MTAQSCSSGQAGAPNGTCGSAEDLTSRGPGTEQTGAQTEDEAQEENICTGTAKKESDPFTLPQLGHFALSQVVE